MPTARYDSTSGTSGETGTGLGLLICKDFIDKNNGAIIVSSEEGKGTTFTIQLPAAKGIPDEPLTENEVKSESVPIASASEIIQTLQDGITAEATGHSLLIVEDNESIRKSIRQVFSGRYEIFEADNGQTGVDLALQHIPNLIISDVMMPRMNGFELCEKLKTDEITSHIPIILLTAEAADERRGAFAGFRPPGDRTASRTPARRRTRSRSPAPA